MYVVRGEKNTPRTNTYAQVLPISLSVYKYIRVYIHISHEFASTKHLNLHFIGSPVIFFLCRRSGKKKETQHLPCVWWTRRLGKFVCHGHTHSCGHWIDGNKNSKRKSKQKYLRENFHLMQDYRVEEIGAFDGAGEWKSPYVTLALTQFGGRSCS